MLETRKTHPNQGTCRRGADLVIPQWRWTCRGWPDREIEASGANEVPAKEVQCAVSDTTARLPTSAVRVITFNRKQKVGNDNVCDRSPLIPFLSFSLIPHN